MQSIDNFMTEWSKREAASSNLRAKIYNGLHIEISRSSRNNSTIRINHIRTTNPKKGELKKFLKWITTQATKGQFNLSMAVQSTGRHFEDTPPKDKLKSIAESFKFSVRYEYPDKIGYEMEYTT